MPAPCIHFGIQTPQEGILYDTLTRAWKMAEDVGFDSAWLDDHFYPIMMPNKEPQMECWTLLAGLVRDTKRIKAGILVGCNSYRNPAVVAKQAVTVDHLSNGRLIFGYGAGWFQPEYAAYGFDYPKPAVRIRALDEALDIIKSLWTQDLTTVDGKFYKIVKARGEPKPVQKPYPPILIGGGGEKMTLKVVAKHANMWNHGGSPDEMKHKIDVLGEHCAKVGRNIKDIEKTWFGFIIIDKDGKKARERMEQRARAYMGNRPDFEGRTIAGSPEECAAKIQKYIDVGVTGFIGMFGKVDNHTGPILFAEKVIPQFQK